MSRYCIIQDQDRCIGCLSCEIYCRENKQLPEGPRLCQIFVLGRRVVRGLPREVLLLLVLVAPTQNGVIDQRVLHIDNDPGRGVDPRELFDGQDRIEKGASLPAVLFRNFYSHQSEIKELL